MAPEACQSKRQMSRWFPRRPQCWSQDRAEHPIWTQRAMSSEPGAPAKPPAEEERRTGGASDWRRWWSRGLPAEPMSWLHWNATFAAVAVMYTCKRSTSHVVSASPAQREEEEGRRWAAGQWVQGVART